MPRAGRIRVAECARISVSFRRDGQLSGVREPGGHFRKNAEPDVDGTHRRADRREGARKPQRARDAARRRRAAACAPRRFCDDSEPAIRLPKGAVPRKAIM